MSFGSGTGGIVDVDPKEVWRALSLHPDSVLVDVRTKAEWAYVGLPDLTAIGKTPVLIEWQTFPTMTVNPTFVADLSATLTAADVSRDAAIYFLCRSGVRSKAAAQAMAAEGWSQGYNIAGGFEGGLDPSRQRGTTEGWKASGLPWSQT
jgi:rhodanese-related sulfurtransferase